VDLVADVLAVHRLSVQRDFGTDPAGERWRWVCMCGSRSGGPSGYKDAVRGSERHVAERVVEALAHGAPAVAGEVAG
jgi:hypothetical protein